MGTYMTVTLPTMASFRFQLFVLIISASTIIGCPPGWKNNGEWCFLFSHNQVTWAEAETICKSFESILAEPEDKNIDSFLIAEALRTRRKYWLGASDIEQEGTFLWTSSQLTL